MATAVTDFTNVRTSPSGAGPVLVQFAYLQGLDILTTLAFLLAGVQEGNPLVRAAMLVAGNPLAGLAAVKASAMLLAIYCWRRGRLTLLQRANLFFAALVAWNLCCLILGLGRLN